MVSINLIYVADFGTRSDILGVGCNILVKDQLF